MHTYTYIYVATHRVKYSQTDGQTDFNVVPKNFSGFSRNSPTVSSYAVKICMYVCIYVRGWSDKCLVSPTDGATNKFEKFTIMLVNLARSFVVTAIGSERVCRF